MPDGSHRLPSEDHVKFREAEDERVAPMLCEPDSEAVANYDVFGCGTMRMYGRGAFHPSGYCFFASSSDTDPALITSSPGFQLTSVATLWCDVSLSESSTLSTSSKLQPAVIGYTKIDPILLSSTT